MAGKTLEQKAAESLQRIIKPKITLLEHNVQCFATLIGVYDRNADRECKKPALVAYVSPKQPPSAINPAQLLKFAREIVPMEHKGYRVFMEYHVFSER